MKKIFLVVISGCILLFVLLGVLTMTQKKDGVQQTVEQNYVNEKGLIRAYGKAQHVEVLSESIGQYMAYLLLIKDEKTFQEQSELLQEHFLVKKKEDVFIKWQLGATVSTNASIDDLRIIRTLKEGSRIFHQPEYAELAQKLEKSLIDHQLTNGILTDFYDWELGEKSREVHLSYIDFAAFKEMPAIDETKYVQMLQGAVEEQTPFFKEVWQIETQTFAPASEKEVNLIDQLLIAIQYVKGTKEKPAAFDQWLKNEWQTQQKIFGQYQRNHIVPNVSYESSAVYALAVQYFLATGEESFAEEIEHTLLEQPPFDVAHDYGSVHFFDYILAQTAAEQMKQR